MKFLSFLCTKWMENCEAMTSSTHSFAYSYGLVKKCFLKNCETSKFHNFLIFQPIFIRFSVFCSENFTLSSEIKLDQLRTSPLTHWRKMSTKRGLYDISYHNSWYRSRKIKEDSSTEREKSPLQFEPIFITVQCTSRSQDFFLIKMIKKSSNWQRF